MTYFQRLRSIARGVLTLILALILLVFSDEASGVVAFIISFSMLVYGFRLLVFYLKMARHMVGGKLCLYRAVVYLDLGLFTSSIAVMNSFIILIYLLGFFAFSGAIDIMRALEAKRGAARWRSKLTNGVVQLFLAATFTFMGIAKGITDILVIGYSFTLIYAAAVRIANAFRKTAIVHIS